MSFMELKTGIRIFALLFLFTVPFALFSGCGGDSDYKRVDFSKTVAISHPDTHPAQDKLLRVAVAAMISPKETFIYYRELLDYIGRNAGLGIQLIQRKTYDEINALFLKGEIDLAFICTGPPPPGKYVEAWLHRRCGKPLPVLLIVEKDSLTTT
jgi:phosphonate transport system substrate-binding protein